MKQIISFFDKKEVLLAIIGINGLMVVGLAFQLFTYKFMFAHQLMTSVA